MAPFRPDNWEELLEEAKAAYPERAGPRRNKRAEREKNRRWVIMRQHKTTKGQVREARSKKKVAIEKNVAKMANMYNTHGFAPAMEYAAAVGVEQPNCRRDLPPHHLPPAPTRPRWKRSTAAQHPC